MPKTKQLQQHPTPDRGLRRLRRGQQQQRKALQLWWAVGGDSSSIHSLAGSGLIWVGWLCCAQLEWISLLYVGEGGIGKGVMGAEERVEKGIMGVWEQFASVAGRQRRPTAFAFCSGTNVSRMSRVGWGGETGRRCTDRSHRAPLSGCLSSISILPNSLCNSCVIYAMICHCSYFAHCMFVRVRVCVCICLNYDPWAVITLGQSPTAARTTELG